VDEVCEFLDGADGEAIGGMGDDVCVDVRGELEADGAAAGAGAVWVVIRDGGDAGEV
jgi:hypothetical protein